MRKGEKERKGKNGPSEETKIHGILRTCHLWIELYNEIIDSLVASGYSKVNVISILSRLQKENILLENTKQTIQRIKMELDCPPTTVFREERIEGIQTKETDINDEQHKQEIREKLFKVVEIPSSVDVLNGLRRWFSVVPPCDVYSVILHSFIARIFI